jgi:uncharacterized protein UPF0182
MASSGWSSLGKIRAVMLLYRNIRERVQRIAPFFRYDDDPYMVISAAGRIVWLLDGYTVSDRFPYSAPTRGLGNYVRNAVKVTVDAYDGTVREVLQIDGFGWVTEDPAIARPRPSHRAPHAPCHRCRHCPGGPGGGIRGVLPGGDCGEEGRRHQALG